MDQLGGVHNVHLARLWSAKKFLLVEGKDVSFLRHFHSLLFSDADIPVDAIPSLPVGGWGGWAYALGSSMTLRNAVGERVVVYRILDSDYHTSKQIEDRYEEAKARGVHLHVWSRRELENYLVHAQVVKRVITARHKASRLKSWLRTVVWVLEHSRSRSNVLLPFGRSPRIERR